jgi:hypothetical protein
MDMFTDPDSIQKGSTFVVDQFPKRTCGELSSNCTELVHAWGICYKEDWNFIRIWWVLGIGFFVPSMLFGVLWAVFREDVQGAFGIASWWMTGGTLLIGILGACSWTV